MTSNGNTYLITLEDFEAGSRKLRTAKMRNNQDTTTILSMQQNRLSIEDETESIGIMIRSGIHKPVRPTKAAVYKRIFQVASLSQKALYLCGILSSAGSGTILPLMTLIFGNFVTIFTGFASGTIHAREFNSHVNHYTLYFVYLFIAKFGLAYLSQLIFAIVASRVTAKLRKSYLHAMLGQSITFHETGSSSGAVSTALSSHCNTIQSGLSDKFGLSLQSISTIVAAFIVAFTSQWKLTLVAATVIPAIVIGVGITSVFESKIEDALNATKADAATIAEEILSSIRTVLALRASDKLLIKYRSYLNYASILGRRRAPILGIQAGLYMFLIYAAYALAFWYGIHLFAAGEAKNSGNVITTLFSIIIGTNAFAQLSGYLGPFLRISSAGAELLKVIDEQPTNPRDVSNAPVVNQPISPHLGVLTSLEDNAAVTFINISFCYPLRPTISVLKNFSLTVPAGKLTALIGPSGSGKSTIVGLLERWYDAGAGKICLGDTDINNISAEDLRSKIGLVQQEPFLFSTTVLENVLHGLPQERLAALSDIEKLDLVVAACKLANAHDFVQLLPNRYLSFVGNRATLLSGGQKQRLAIARAVIGNPPILILDEATSSLDPASEKIVQQALDSAAKGRTTIAIAHRLSTIRNADNIVVLNAGSVVEQGNHDELMSIENGTYRRMLISQSLSLSGHSQGSNSQMEFASSAVKEESDGPTPLIMPISDSKSYLNPRFGIFKSVFQTLQEQRHNWTIFSVLFICSVIGGALFPLQAYFYSQVVTAFQLTGSNIVHRGDFWALMFFILSLVVGIAYFAIGAAGEFLGESTVQSYRFSYLTSMVKQSVAFFDDSANSCGSLLSRLATEPDAIKSLAGPNLSVMIVVGVSLLSTITLSLAIGWKLGLVAIFGALPFIFFSGLVHETMEQKFEEIVNETFADSVGFASECIQAIKTVTALNMENQIEDRFEALLNAHCAKARQHAMKSMVWFSLSESIELLCMGLTFWYGGHLIASHEYSTAQFFIVFVAIVLCAQSSGQFFAHSLDITKGNIAYNAVRSLQVSELNDAAPSDLETKTILDKSTAPLIEFKNAKFAYPSRPSQPVLQNMDLKLQKGQFIAIVGASGCGKSTILGLLERFYDLNDGDLMFNGKNVSKISRDEMRSQFSLVSQEPVLFQGTIRENILLGTNTNFSDAALDNIARQAQILDLIKSLPEGYNTKVGSRGTALSGGQKQRVAIARAIAMDKEILLLDEATSALDSESEMLVHEALKEAGKNRSIISIAHRLSTIQHADLIYVLGNGRVVESGSHAALLDLKGLYFNMCQTQGLTVEG